MSAALEKLDRQIARETRRVEILRAQKKARAAAIRMHDFEQAQRAAKIRHQQLARLAGQAQLEEFSPVEVLGILLDGKERARHSPTVRMAVRKRGEEWLASAAPQTTRKKAQRNVSAAA